MADQSSNFEIKQEPPLPTVRIASDDTPMGYIVINKSDFDPKVHKKWQPKDAKSDTPPA